jgi:outer membrane protein assembly factor BamB
MTLALASRYLLPLAVAGGLAACAGDAPRKPAALPEITARVDIRSPWRIATGDAGHTALRPATHGDAVFVATAAGEVGRYVGGQPVWRVRLGRPLSGGVASDGEQVIVATPKGEVIALSAADGSERWRGRVSSEVLSPAAFAGGSVLVRSGDHRLFALDARDGSRQWVLQRSTPPLTLRVTAPPVVAENLAFIGYPGGKLLAVGVANGAVLWEGAVALPKGTTELERMADVAGAPVLGPREVCAAAYQGRVACFDLASGNLIWANELSADTSVALDSAHVYVTDADGLVAAYARADGKLVWRQEALKWRRLTSPLVRRGHLLVGDDEGVIHALRQGDGALVGRLASEGGALSGDPVVAGELTLFQSRKGGVIAVAID